MKVNQILYLILGLVIIENIKSSKLSLSFYEIGENQTLISDAKIESEEDNRQVMRGVLKDLRTVLLDRFKKNKKTRRKTGKLILIDVE